MTQPSRMLSFAVCAAALLFLVQRAGAQNAPNLVTPVIQAMPSGQVIVVNNTLGAQHTDPHVDGDLVCYTNQPTGKPSSINYHNLAAGTDNVIPPFPGVPDFLCDVRGATIVFTRDDGIADIFTFDTASPTFTQFPNPMPNTGLFGGQISDQTVVWQESSVTSATSSIVAWDLASNTATVISGPSPSANTNSGISPDGGVVVWEYCATNPTSCVVWKAVRSSAGVWNSQQLVSSLLPATIDSHPDTDGTIVAYAGTSSTSQIAWQPVAGGVEQVLNIPGNARNPSVSGGLILFDYDPAGSGVNELALYDTRSNFLYHVPAYLHTDTNDADLNDVSMTPDGQGRVVWQQLDNGQWNVYAYTFTLSQGDFNFGAISPLTIAPGGSASTNVSVNPVNGFASAVNLSVTGQPAGVTATVAPNQVTPSSGNSANSILNVSVADAVTPGSFTLTVTGASGTLNHSATANVTVTATTTSIGNLIGDLLNAGCINNSGIANALSSKLAAAQSAGSVQAAINTLTALKNQINAQASKHIATSCTVAGVALNPVTALLLDVQGLIDSLRVSLTPDPITGYVTDASGMGLPGATVSILDAGNNVVATAASDITGFYFMATTGVLTPGATYTLQVTGFPAGFANSTPPNQQFLWQGSAVALSNFVLN